jgi:hypothetical protein
MKTQKRPCKRCNPKGIPFSQIPVNELSSAAVFTFSDGRRTHTIAEPGGVPIYTGHYGSDGRCDTCGGHVSRIVKSNWRRQRKIGGKRGKNSGKVSQHGKK